MHQRIPSAGLSWRQSAMPLGLTSGSQESHRQDHDPQALHAATAGGICQSVTGGTTEAGLRGTLKSDAIPVVLTIRAKRGSRQANSQTSCRLHASPSEGLRSETTSGGANSFEIRSMFCVSSINVNLIQKADIDRFCVLGLMRDDSQEEDFWRKFEQRILAACTDENGRKLISRTIKNIPVIRQNARTFSTALGRKFGARFGDQNGTLLAGFFSLTLTAVRSSVDTAMPWWNP